MRAFTSGSVNRLLEEHVVQVPWSKRLHRDLLCLLEAWQLVQTPVNFNLIAAVRLPSLLLQGQVPRDVSVISLHAWAGGVELSSDSCGRGVVHEWALVSCL